MKRYERMSKEAIMDAYKTTDHCCGCRLEDSSYCKTRGATGCCEIMTDYLNEEVNVVPRWKTIKSDEDLPRLSKELTDWCANHECAECIYRSYEHNCFTSYLLETIEVEDAE